MLIGQIAYAVWWASSGLNYKEILQESSSGDFGRIEKIREGILSELLQKIVSGVVTGITVPTVIWLFNQTKHQYQSQKVVVHSVLRRFLVWFFTDLFSAASIIYAGYVLHYSHSSFFRCFQWFNLLFFVLFRWHWGKVMFTAENLSHVRSVFKAIPGLPIDSKERSEMTIETYLEDMEHELSSLKTKITAIEAEAKATGLKDEKLENLEVLKERYLGIAVDFLTEKVRYIDSTGQLNLIFDRIGFASLRVWYFRIATLVYIWTALYIALIMDKN